MMVYIMILCLWLHICIHVVIRFEFKLYMLICIHVVWSVLNIYYLIFFLKIHYRDAGVVLD